MGWDQPWSFATELYLDSTYLRGAFLFYNARELQLNRARVVD